MPQFKFLPGIPVPGPEAIKDAIGAREMFRTLEPMQSESEGDDTGFCEVKKLPATHANATAVTSKLPDGQHMPVIDIDLPCMLVPSSKPGHFHLYIEKEMSWEKYGALLEALEAAGVIGPGYLQYSKRRGYTTVRYPGVTKENEWQRIEEGMTEAEQAERERARKRNVEELGKLYNALGAMAINGDFDDETF